MSAIPAGRHQDPGRYEIRVKGHLDTRWAAWFDGLSHCPTAATAPPSSKAR